MVPRTGPWNVRLSGTCPLRAPRCSDAVLSQSSPSLSSGWFVAKADCGRKKGGTGEGSDTQRLHLELETCRLLGGGAVNPVQLGLKSFFVKAGKTASPVDGTGDAEGPLPRALLLS